MKQFILFIILMALWVPFASAGGPPSSPPQSISAAVVVDDTPSDGNTTEAASSNSVYDHINGADPHTVYRLESADVDPDELAGDTVDDNKVDPGIVNITSADLGLVSAHIFVGNAGNVAADVAVSGDATMANNGAMTVTGATNGLRLGAGKWVDTGVDNSYTLFAGGTNSTNGAKLFLFGHTRTTAAQQGAFLLQGGTMATDVEADPSDLKGAHAYASATVNLDGAAINVTGGNGASGSAGDADGGDINLSGGTGYGTGTEGNIKVLVGGFIPKKVTADPCTAMPEGSIFYNDTSNYLCYCNGSADVKMSDDTTACF